jgi:hypothetical protein
MNNRNGDMQTRKPTETYLKIIYILCYAFITLVFLLFIAAICDQVAANFEANIRRTFNRMENELRLIAPAIDAYYSDHKTYPAWAMGGSGYHAALTPGSPVHAIPTFRMTQSGEALATLSTPVTYYSQYPRDEFARKIARSRTVTFAYWVPPAGNGWILWSPGPDGRYDLTLANIAQAYDPATSAPSTLLIGPTYDPTNGTSSAGDVYRIKQ